jgi:hypothetical protein
MYPQVTQLETRRQELERSFASRPQTEQAGPGAARHAPAGPPRYKLALLTWAAAGGSI